MKTIIIPVDGQSNIKLEALDFDSLKTVFSRSTKTPVTQVNGLDYNCTTDECNWFDRSIDEMPADLRDAAVIAPVARGASGGLIGADNSLVEVPGKGLTLAYTQKYPERVEDAFCRLAGSDRVFFLETGAVRSFPGSIVLMKRFVFEELERPELVEASEFFGTYGVLISGHFLGGDYLFAAREAGNEHSYWMCHSGARNIKDKPGTPSSLCSKIESYKKLVPVEPTVAYEIIGTMPPGKAAGLGLYSEPGVVPGGHDTCLSHIPVMSTYYQSFGISGGSPVIHVEAGSWTMIAQIGGDIDLPADGFSRDIVVQGTVDGEPVVTARYGGGNDFRYVRELIRGRGYDFGGEYDERLLEETARSAECFILPNISPVNHLTGPFPKLKGKILNEDSFFSKPERAFVIANMTTAFTTACQIEAVSGDRNLHLVITAAGAKDPYFGRLLATVTGRKVYGMFDKDGLPITETTTLGAAIVGKAAILKTHPYSVDMSALGVSYKEQFPFTGELKRLIDNYRKRFLKLLDENTIS